jgi:hypothetical protein
MRLNGLVETLGRSVRQASSSPVERIEPKHAKLHSPKERAYSRNGERRKFNHHNNCTKSHLSSRLTDAPVAHTTQTNHFIANILPETTQHPRTPTDSGTPPPIEVSSQYSYVPSLPYDVHSLVRFQRFLDINQHVPLNGVARPSDRNLTARIDNYNPPHHPLGRENILFYNYWVERYLASQKHDQNSPNENDESQPENLSKSS